LVSKDHSFDQLKKWQHPSYAYHLNALAITVHIRYPDFVELQNGCLNNGLEAPYMKQAPESYLFSSKAECCDAWFSYDEFCKTSSSNAMKFFPNFSVGMCDRKQEKEFESWERERYDSLEECCSAKFAYSYDTCCSAPGLEGCATTGVVLFIPNWSSQSCVGKDEASLQPWEEIYATTASKCCSTNFGWKRAECCKESGGC
jgi:hypothetical protein